MLLNCLNFICFLFFQTNALGEIFDSKSVEETDNYNGKNRNRTHLDRKKYDRVIPCSRSATSEDEIFRNCIGRKSGYQKEVWPPSMFPRYNTRVVNVQPRLKKILNVS